MRNSVKITGTFLGAQRFASAVIATIAGIITMPGGRTRTFYERVKVFGKTGEYLLGFEAGTVVSVDGKMQQRTVEKDGNRRSYTDIVGLRVNRPAGDFEFQKDKKDQAVLLNAVNTVALEGNLVRAPQAIGESGAYATIAVDETFTTREGEERSVTNFISVKAWGGAAQALLAMSKGAKISVEGAALTSSFENDEGEKQFRLEVTATLVSQIFAGKPSDEAGTDAADSESAASPAPAAQEGDDSEVDLPF